MSNFQQQQQKIRKNTKSKVGPFKGKKVNQQKPFLKKT